MKNLNCNQIKIFMNLEIIEEEDKHKYICVCVYIYISFLNLPNFLQFGDATWRNHGLIKNHV